MRQGAPLRLSHLHLVFANLIYASWCWFVCSGALCSKASLASAADLVPRLVETPVLLENTYKHTVHLCRFGGHMPIVNLIYASGCTFVAFAPTSRFCQLDLCVMVQLCVQWGALQ
jgi:hypothetical protein